jgi:hypothetical protein
MVLQQSNHHAKATLFLALRPSTILPAASQGWFWFKLQGQAVLGRALMRIRKALP